MKFVVLLALLGLLAVASARPQYGGIGGFGLWDFMPLFQKRVIENEKHQNDGPKPYYLTPTCQGFQTVHCVLQCTADKDQGIEEKIEFLPPGCDVTPEFEQT